MINKDNRDKWTPTLNGLLVDYPDMVTAQQAHDLYNRLKNDDLHSMDAWLGLCFDLLRINKKAVTNV